MERRIHGIARCAINVLLDEAADEANAIIAAESELRRRRADLDGLAQLVTNEGRRLNGVPPMLPAQISRALYSPDRRLTGADRGLALTDWRAEYAALCEADLGEVEAGPLSDAAEPEAL